ncbi:hypothetical protein [Silvimonas sp.]|uniref:hypothetical protein n=1 Tax=Silvimonas sp. TaxID=2650811 RepID=UPI00283D15F0|nr:hypothetical protein [Silvimonas sp.]MDR3428782.1 hypothetical protein [Silvimonas sp.]
MLNHYVLMINPRGEMASNETIEGALYQVAKDWLRFARGQYLIAAEGGPEPIFEAVRKSIKLNDDVVVIEINLSNRMGWASNLAINWIKKYAP